FEKGDKIVTLKKIEDGNYHLNDGKYNYYVNKDGKVNVENEGVVNVVRNESVGMVSDNSKTTAINKGTIKLEGSGSGILSTDGGQGINKGDIEVTSTWNEEKNNWNRVAGITTEGEGSLGINEKSGKIVVKNSGVGMEAKENSTVINKGNIEVEGNNEYEMDSEGNEKEIWGSTGLVARTGSTAINEGYIKTTGSSNNGMNGSGEATLKNSGTIEMNSKVKYIDDSWFDSEGNFIEERGMGYSFETMMNGRENSYLENSGTLLGEGSILSIVAKLGSNALNTGNILITGKVQKIEEGEPIYNEDSNHVVSYSVGMRARENSTIVNEGNIIIKGGDSAGMDTRQGSEGVNKGDITLESSQYLNTEKYENEDGEEISREYLEHTHIEGMRAREESEVINEKNINIKGRGVGIIALENSVATNEGDIYGESITFLQKNSYTDSEGNLVEEEREEETYITGMEAYRESSIE
ncbi:MAG: hypothetical protein ACRCZ9_09275, partial [Fusobacteriaceae bacterium]